MTINPYDPCPCGRPRQFKWCCQPIHEEIDRAFRQEANGQHAAALQILDEVIANHPEHPEPLGRKAHLLYDQGRRGEAETTLQRALDLDQAYPHGLFLRGLFCYQVGNLPEAIAWFRKALGVYDPKSEQYCQIFTLISEGEFQLQRPLAARAALAMAMRLRPGREEFATAEMLMFGPRSPFPAISRQDPGFRAPTTELDAEHRQAWDAALAAAEPFAASLDELEQLTKDHEQDPSAWFNLGLGRARLGDNPGALAAFERSVELDTDPARTAQTGTLGEVLRQGHGLEDACDFIEYSHYFRVTDSSALLALLEPWLQERRLIPFDANPQRQSVTGVILKAETPAASEVSGSVAYLVLVGDRLRLWHTNRDTLAKVCDELARHCGSTLVETDELHKPAPFKELLAEAFGFPRQTTEAATAKALVLAHTQNYFEKTWIHRPLKALSGMTPAEAVRQPSLKKKLLGVIQFLQECAVESPAKDYDFDRLRRIVDV